MTGSNQGRTVSARAATDIDDGRSLGQIGAEQIGNFNAWLFNRRTGAVNVFAVKKHFVFRRDNVAVGTIA